MERPTITKTFYDIFRTTRGRISMTGRSRIAAQIPDREFADAFLELLKQRYPQYDFYLNEISYSHRVRRIDQKFFVVTNFVCCATAPKQRFIEAGGARSAAMEAVREERCNLIDTVRVYSSSDDFFNGKDPLYTRTEQE